MPKPFACSMTKWISIQQIDIIRIHVAVYTFQRIEQRPVLAPVCNVDKSSCCVKYDRGGRQPINATLISGSFLLCTALLENSWRSGRWNLRGSDPHHVVELTRDSNAHHIVEQSGTEFILVHILTAQVEHHRFRVVAVLGIGRLLRMSR
jgi:hypothetical protein